MTDTDAVESELESHDAFVQRPESEGYDLETTVFETRVDVAAADGKRDGEFTVTVFLPSLSAAVAPDSDPAVEPVVEDGWYETLERRLEDTFSVANTGTYEEPSLERDPEEVRVVLEYIAWDAREGVEDAKTLIEYVEGTYAQGLIPGYEYRGEAATLLESAQTQGDGDGPMPM